MHLFQNRRGLLRSLFGWGLVAPLALCFSPGAFGEYRAFELRIEKIDNPEDHRVIISNLDPLQYRGFYVVQHDERVYYTKTWMCHGRTGNFRKICDPPAARDLATEDAGDPALDAEPPTSVEKSPTP